MVVIHTKCKSQPNPINLLFSLQMLSSLSLKSAIVTYEGSPAFPAVDSLWDITAKHRVTHLGTSPKYISACMRAGVEPGGRNDLQPLRTILSTGSPLSSEQYDWIYSHVKVCSEFYINFYILQSILSVFTKHHLS